ncbi:MAG: RsmD family RNA methyltransferase [Flavobacterium sp.]|nr:RsmD family RNA methyltransferase [Flavobacterium sp.]
MNLSVLLSPEIQTFIQQNTGMDAKKLALQKNPFPDVDFKIILNQIEARTKSKEKLPTWFNAKNIIFPSKISVEQTSSEITAQYKSKLISGNNLIDLTGGFGVDDYYFSQKVKHLVHCEINDELSEIVQHNFQQLNCTNIKCFSGDSSDFLTQNTTKFDWIYIDPSRRNDAKGKVFMLKDCLPNVPDLIDFYFNHSDNILIKTAPILDITAGLSELKNVKEVHIVAIENEVKELLWVIKKEFQNSIAVKTINITKSKVCSFDFQYNYKSEPNYSLPQKYLYEPNSAIMKSGGFDAICDQFPLNKLHKNSHLYTSNECIDFPGRIFEIEQSFDYSKKSMKAFLGQKKANITTRNFPETVENIRKKWKIKEGGDCYCFFTTNQNNDKIVLLCTKLNST